MYEPTTGRWLSEDPIDFLGEDANLYRYVANSSTNATDPTGQYLLASDERSAKTALKELAEYGIKNVKTYQMDKSYIYLDVNPEQWEALFSFANKHWEERLFAKGVKQQTKDWLEAAAERTRFLVAAGVAGEALAERRHVTFHSVDEQHLTIQTASLDRNEVSWIKAVRAQAKRKERPIYLDVGGEGRYVKDKTAGYVINVNYVGISNHPDFRDKPIPNWLYADLNKDRMPFLDKSVSYMYYENMLGPAKWASEILRVMKPDGNIKVYSTEKGLELTVGDLKKEHPKIKVDNTVGDYRKDGGKGAVITVPK